MGPGPEGRSVRGEQWTDNVARVYEVIRRHPEVSVEWPRWSGRKEFRASWPANPADEKSEIRSIQTEDVSSLAIRLEREFPDDRDRAGEPIGLSCALAHYPALPLCWSSVLPDVALRRDLLDWLVASERELAAAGDDEARERLEALLGEKVG